MIANHSVLTEAHVLARVKEKHAAFRREVLKGVIAGVVTLSAIWILNTNVEVGGILAVIGVFGMGWAFRGSFDALKIDTHFHG